MKATGIVRKVDELGRIVLPSELRKTMHVSVGDSFELFTHDNTVVLKKYEPGCILTGLMDELVEYQGRKVSKQAIKEMAELAGIM
ncbi:MAG: AbrB/MazE/SpoVT family DNA-binding domain-containing protein [Defluviitaleaceae bacterium]|nr:AbrB/MazE/SpoVT family DNA-binding domain-containing protein [Defluviitaleaceae bacterium]